MTEDDGVQVRYDTGCDVCRRSMRFLARQPGARRIVSGPLYDDDDPSTMVLVDAAGRHVRSTAALRAVVHAGGRGRHVARVLLWVPRPVRDWAYDVFARHRHLLARRS